MKLLLRLLIAYAANLAALAAAGTFVPGVTVDFAPAHLAVTAGILTLLTLVLLPILSFFTKPFIILSLGLLVLALNAVLLLILDSVSTWVTIGGLQPLAYATLITTGAHALTRILSPR